MIDAFKTNGASPPFVTFGSSVRASRAVAPAVMEFPAATSGSVSLRSSPPGCSPQ